MLRPGTLTILLLGLTGLAEIAPTCRAQGFVEHLEPPVVERGKTTRVKVVGNGMAKAVDLWTTLPAGTLKAMPVGEPTASQAIFDVTVAANGPVGIAGARLSTTDGLGNAFLFLVDDLPVRTTTAPAKVALPAAVWGRVREAMVDRYAIDVTAGQKVSFEVVGSRLGKDVDPLLTIRDAQGRFVLQRDNDPGLYYDCRFEHTFAAAGTYTVEVCDARYHGNEHGFYVLRMGRFPAGRVAVPAVVRPGKRGKVRLPELAGRAVGVDAPAALGPFLGVLRRPGDEGSSWLPLEAADDDVTVHQAPGNTMEQATPAKVPGMLCGVLDKPGETNFFRLELSKGQRIVVRAEARALNSPADLELAITDKAGKDLRRVGENPQEEVVLDFNAGNGGVFGLRVGDVSRDGGPAFAYRLEVRNAQPQIQVLAEVEGLTVPRGDHQTVPLTLTRTEYAGPVSLSLVGAPAGLTLAPSEIAEGATSIVCKLAANAETPLGLHTLQILAKPVKVADARPTLVHTRPLIDRQIINVDLIPHALREDQRRLPPALTDRFAIQVMPGAPFTLELPEALVTLPRYAHVEFPIVTKRLPGFAGPITFAAKGGQLAPKEEGRTRVYAELPEATTSRPRALGSIHSKILTNTGKYRIDLTASGTHQGHRVSLTRTFELDVRTAFLVNPEPAKLSLLPGDGAKVRLNVDRLKPFDADVTVHLSQTPGVSLPEEIVIPRGQTGVDVELKVAADRPPGRVNISVGSTGIVNGFEESERGRQIELDVMTTPVKKK